MSVWGDMRRRAEGSVIRKEDLPPVEVQVKREPVIIEKKKDRMIDTGSLRKIILAGIGALVFGILVCLGCSDNIIRLLPILMPIQFIINRGMLEIISDDDDWD